MQRDPAVTFFLTDTHPPLPVALFYQRLPLFFAGVFLPLVGLEQDLLWGRTPLKAVSSSLLGGQVISHGLVCQYALASVCEFCKHKGPGAFFPWKQWGVRTSKGQQRPLWNWDRRAVAAILTLGHLSLLPDVPGVQGCPFLGLHGSALVEVLGEVGLVQTSRVHHLTLRDVVLLEVRLHHLCYSPGILSGRNRKHFSEEKSSTCSQQTWIASKCSSSSWGALACHQHHVWWSQYSLAAGEKAVPQCATLLSFDSACRVKLHGIGNKVQKMQHWLPLKCSLYTLRSAPRRRLHLSVLLSLRQMGEMY